MGDEWWAALGAVRPEDATSVRVSGGTRVDVPTIRLGFRDWKDAGPKPTWAQAWPDTYGKPLVVGGDGQRSVAEIEIVRRLRHAGWEAAWIDTFGGAPAWMRPWTDRGIGLPTAVAGTLARLRSASVPEGRPWDIVAWRVDRILFIEAKRWRRDRLRPGQVAWLAAAVRQRLPDVAFGIVEWDITRG
jgi:hypothetical protein